MSMTTSGAAASSTATPGPAPLWRRCLEELFTLLHMLVLAGVMYQAIQVYRAQRPVYLNLTGPQSVWYPVAWAALWPVGYGVLAWLWRELRFARSVWAASITSRPTTPAGTANTGAGAGATSTGTGVSVPAAWLAAPMASLGATLAGMGMTLAAMLLLGADAWDAGLDGRLDAAMPDSPILWPVKISLWAHEYLVPLDRFLALLVAVYTAIRLAAAVTKLVSYLRRRFFGG